MSDVLKEVPEFFEAQLGDSLILRTESLGAFLSLIHPNKLGHFRELGPPDLCHITKTQNKPEPPKVDPLLTELLKEAVDWLISSCFWGGCFFNGQFSRLHKYSYLCTSIITTSLPG